MLPWANNCSYDFPRNAAFMLTLKVIATTALSEVQPRELVKISHIA